MTVLTDELLARRSGVTDVAKGSRCRPDLQSEESGLQRDAVFARSGNVSAEPVRPNVGDYFTTTVGNEPIIVARAKDGSVRAFSAVCQHRGMQVVDDAGNCTKFTCPYHQWSYDLTGRLLGAPAMERTEAFDKKDHPLPALSVELWQGFVFVNLLADPRPLAPTDQLRPSSQTTDSSTRLPRHVHAAHCVERKVMSRTQGRLPREQRTTPPGLLSEELPRSRGVDAGVDVIFRTKGYTHTTVA